MKYVSPGPDARRVYIRGHPLLFLCAWRACISNSRLGSIEFFTVGNTCVVRKYFLFKNYSSCEEVHEKKPLFLVPSDELVSTMVQDLRSLLVSIETICCSWEPTSLWAYQRNIAFSMETKFIEGPGVRKKKEMRRMSGDWILCVTQINFDPYNMQNYLANEDLYFAWKILLCLYLLLYA